MQNEDDRDKQQKSNEGKEACNQEEDMDTEKTSALVQHKDDEDNNKSDSDNESDKENDADDMSDQDQARGR
eukprot:11664223-Ditylum_brightwellii.AAC.1